MSDQNVIIFLVQVFLLLGISRILGEVLNRFRQPAVSAEIFVGILLGPTILGRFLPQVHEALFPNNAIQLTMFETVAWLGMFFFLLETGLEMDFSSAWRQKSEAMTIAFMDILVPMVLGFVCAWFLPDHYLVSPESKVGFALFMATILTVSAMPITVRALRDMNLSKTDLGFLIMSALSVNDVIGWLLFTIVFGFFIQAHADIPFLLKTFGEAVFFVAFCLTGGRYISNWIVDQFQKRKLPEPASSLTFVFLLGLWSGAAAQKFGMHALFGFFLAGVMAGQAKGLSEKTRHTIGRMVYAIFVPLFFAGIGLKMDFFEHFDLFLTLFVAIVGIGVRFLGAWLGFSMTQLPRVNRMAVAIAHTPGGMMEIVMGLVALQYNLITPTVFVSVVLGALVTAVVMGPWFSYAITRRRKISIFEYFTRRGIVVPLHVRSPRDAVQVLAGIAANESGIAEEDIVDAALEREAMMGTAMEGGVAIPHARLTQVHKPLIIFGRSLSGIDWNSPDGQMTHFVFLIMTPTQDDAIHVQILQAIARVMREPANMAAVMNAKDATHVWGVFHQAFENLYVKQDGT